MATLTIYYRIMLAAVLLLAAGCATHERRLMAIRDGFYAGDLPIAETALANGLQHDRRDRDVLQLEQSIVELAGGRPQEAERTLREVRDRFDELERARTGRSALSLITDDTYKTYAGEDYEKVLIRAFLSIANLLGDGQDAGAYALQVTAKQQQIIAAAAADSSDGPNPKLAYKQVAAGPYLRGLIREATHSNYDDAARASALVVNWAPQFRYGRADLERARHGHHSAPGNGVLYVFALVGRGPYKEEAVELPTTVSLLIADRILSATNKYSLPPTIAPVKVPRVVVPP
ncbi:MAG TPA: tetratricopeptide repeat protein, partial [Pirellulales bacterium]